MSATIYLVLQLAVAASGGHGEGHGEIPYMTIIAQLVNLSALILLIGFLTKKQIRSLFAGRKQDFEIALQRARVAREDAENRQKEIMTQLKQIEDTYEDSIKKAELKAEQLRQTMVEEAKATAARIKQETEATYRNEVNAAMLTLKNELLQGSLEKAEDLLKTKMQKTDHESLQNNLVKTIGAAK